MMQGNRTGSRLEKESIATIGNVCRATGGNPLSMPTGPKKRPQSAPLLINKCGIEKLLRFRHQTGSQKKNEPHASALADRYVYRPIPPRRARLFPRELTARRASASPPSLPPPRLSLLPPLPSPLPRRRGTRLPVSATLAPRSTDVNRRRLLGVMFVPALGVLTCAPELVPGSGVARSLSPCPPPPPSLALPSCTLRVVGEAGGGDGARY